jgi:hypothetical protein
LPFNTTEWQSHTNTIEELNPVAREGSMSTEPATATVIHWIGRKPPEGIKCNKPTGICGYLDCADEGRCLDKSKAKPS